MVFQLLEVPFLLVTVVFAIRASRACRGPSPALDPQLLGRGLGLLTIGFVFMGIGHLLMQTEASLGVDPLVALLGPGLGPTVWYVTLVLTWGFSCLGFYQILNASVEAKLRSETRALVKAANLDPLTGAFNRRGLDREFERLLSEAERSQGLLSVLMLDLDDFKAVNDRFGHVVGDRVLTTATEAIDSLLRENAILGRPGGEEFCVLVPDADIGGATVLAERIREKMANLGVKSDGAVVPVTVSIGIAELGSDGTDPEALIAAADRRLYRAKRCGRNRTVSVDEDPCTRVEASEQAMTLSGA